MFGGNPWDWLIIITLLVYAVAIGILDEEGKFVIQRELIVRSVGVMGGILVIFNLPQIISFFI